MLSFKQIENETAEIISFFKDKTDFLAHTHQRKPDETLHEHISEVKNYFAQIIQLNGLEPIIDNAVFAGSIHTLKWDLNIHLSVLIFLLITV